MGAGPAGLSAAASLAERGYQVSVLDAAAEAGGLLRYGIPEYRLPKAALNADIQRLKEQGIEFKFQQKLGSDFSVGQLLSQGNDAVFLAIGAGVPRTLTLNQESRDSAPELVYALDYLRQAPTSEKPFAGGRVVVVGGGNAGVDAARTARRHGASAVTMVCPEPRAQMPALPDELQAAESEGIEVITEVQPEALVDRGVRLKALGGSGDPARTLKADSVIVAIGQNPELQWLEAESFSLKRSADGLIEVDPKTGATSHPKVFAGGDLTTSPRNVTAAMASGLNAAHAIDCALRGQELAHQHPAPPGPGQAATAYPDAATLASCPPAARVAAKESPADHRTKDFSEVISAYTEAEAKQEASRCMLCGLCGNCNTCIDTFACPALTLVDKRASIDPTLCTGCAVCVELCPNGAIQEVGQA